MAELKIISMDEVPVEEVEWLWYPYIPYGKLTIIHGDGGEGKTTLILRLAALLSRGEKLPCDDTEREPIKVIYQTAEDGLGDTIKPRLLAGNADCSQIKVIDESEAALTMLDERVEKAIAETGARVMILDPMQAYIGAKVDMNRANEVRTILSQLGRIAEKYRCAIILVRHLNKAQGNKSNYRGLGSIDFQTTARSVLVVGRVKDKPEIRVAAHQKSSLAPEGKPIAFELNEANGFKWLGHYDISIDDLLSGISREKKSDMAESLIVDCLSGGKYPQQTLLQKAQSLGISKRVLDEAKKTLRVRSIKEGDYFIPCLTLPAEKENKQIGIWGQRHKRYLQEHKRATYANLLTSGKLNSYLADIDEQAEELFSRLVNEYADRQGVTEQLKAENQLLWIQKMSNIQSCVREVVESEIIYS